jgi:hypothetical protein
MTDPNGTNPPASPRGPQQDRALRMTPSALGGHLAHLVWESFSDDLADASSESLLRSAGLLEDDGMPGERVASELLIFLLWAHTRAAQLAFLNAPSKGVLKETLDEMHRAFFFDMQENGLPQAQLPLFEQQVSARYSEYHAASAVSDGHLGAAVAGHFLGGAKRSGDFDRLAAQITDRAIEVAHPLKDFLGEVDLQ